jgi:hypothetical protein
MTYRTISSDLTDLIRVLETERMGMKARYL